MSVNSDKIYTAIYSLKNSNIILSSTEITKWGKYDKINAYDLFWSNEYLFIYKALLEYSLNYFVDGVLVENDVFTEKELQYILDKVKEIQFKYGEILL
jgi:hypothetical protein